MRLANVFGIILIILGVIALAIGTQAHTRPHAPLLGLIFLIGGIILVIFSSRVKRKPPPS